MFEPSPLSVEHKGERITGRAVIVTAATTLVHPYALRSNTASTSTIASVSSAQ